MEKKHPIFCTVKSCLYNVDCGCSANEVTVGLDNAIHADRDSETSCKTFKQKK